MDTNGKSGEAADEWLPRSLETRAEPKAVQEQSAEEWTVQGPHSTRTRIALERQRSGLGPPPPDATPSDGVLDLNAAGFGQLRALGLTITQSARLIAARERLGGFGSMAEVEGLPGFPRDVKAMLRERCRI